MEQKHVTLCLYSLHIELGKILEDEEDRGLEGQIIQSIKPFNGEQN